MGDGPTRRSRDHDGPGRFRRVLSALSSQLSARTRLRVRGGNESVVGEEFIPSRVPRNRRPKSSTLDVLSHSGSSRKPGASVVSVLCLVFLLTSSVLGAAAWCTIDVEVMDARAVALEGVDVRAEASVLFDARRLVTGPDGAAVLLGLPAGSYRLEITREGYQWLEVQDVRCEPGGVIRLTVTLESTEGDEVVILPSGPSVDPEGAMVGHLYSREAQALLPWRGTSDSGPGGVTDGAGAAGSRPADANAFEGVVQAGHPNGPGPRVVAVPRHPERGLHGRVAIDAGGGLQARPTGTRGEVTRLDDVVRVRASVGGIAADSHLGTLLALEMDTADLDSQAAFGNGVSVDAIQRRRQWDRDSVLAYGVLDWMPTPDNRVDLRLNWGRRRQKGFASSLHIMPDAPLPGGEQDHLNRAVGLEWDALASDVLAVRVAGGFSDTSLRWMPTGSGLMEQDQSSDGRWSGGLGNGVWGGDGGVAAFDQGVDDLQGEVGLEWSAGSGHRLGIEVSWRREDRELRYSGAVDDVGLGTRRTHRGPGAERWDSLTPPVVSRGLLEECRVVLRDAWRAGSGLTVVLGLEIGDIRFDAGGDGPGYRFGVDDALSPRVGLVWDFEGAGRSRAWARWARFHQGPGEAARWRLTGALDLETVFVNDDGSLWERSPGPIGVASDLEPAVIDETVFGVEYELLSHLVVGAAGAFRRSEGGLAVLTEDGGRTFRLDTPSGDAWPERLNSETLESWGWIRKRLANGWQTEVRVGWRRSRGAWRGPPDLDLVDLDREYLSDVLSPAALEGAWGPLPDDRRWHFEVSGSWLFADGPSVGGRLSYRSGAPVSRLGALADGLGLDRRFTENRGSAGRTPELWRLDLVGSWPFEVGMGRVEVYLELSNLLDSGRAVRLDERWTLLDDAQAAGLDPDEQRTAGTWGEPLVVQRPLELRVGLAYRW